MASQRLRSTLYHSVPKPMSRPPPLWQIATALDAVAVPTVTTAHRPATSAVAAGWTCVGIGLLTAWFFPLAHVFFSVAIILSVVAMATHQVRSGLLLLAGSLASIGVCVILFVCGVAVIVAGALHAATKPRPDLASFPRPASTPSGAIFAVDSRPPVAQRGTVSGNTNFRPLALEEVLNLLGEGKGDNDVLTATANRPLLVPLGPSELTSLRAYGASERLIGNLRGRMIAGNYRPAPYVAPQVTYTWGPDATPPIEDASARTIIAAPAMPASQSSVLSAPMPTPVDYATRDHQIASLKSQIDALDEQVRCIRNNPKDNRYWWHYSSSRFNGIDQAALDAYLKELDRQRNDLRRQKWALEGR